MDLEKLKNKLGSYLLKEAADLYNNCENLSDKVLVLNLIIEIVNNMDQLNHVI